MTLKALYKLENENDSSGNNYTLTNVNNVTFTGAKFANGANFGSSNSTKYLYTSNTMDINGNAITMMGWFKSFAEIASGGWTLLNQSNATSKVTYYMLYEYNSGTRRLVFWRTKLNVANEGFTYNITLGTNWNHIVLTYDNTNIKGYLNGQPIGTATTSGNGTGSYPQGFAIGRNINNDAYYASILADNVKVYNEALSDGAIFLAYREGCMRSGVAIGSPMIF